jgi:hypothetical protein
MINMLAHILVKGYIFYLMALLMFRKLLVPINIL